MLKALVFQYDARVVDKPKPPIPVEHLFIKVHAVALNGIENAVYGGMLWVEPGRVLGVEGYGRVEYLGVNADKSFSGKLVAGYPKSSKGIPGIDYDGWAAEYTSQPMQGVGLLPPNIDDVVAAATAGSASIALYVAEKSMGKSLLVIGSGYTGILAAYFAKHAVNIGVVGNMDKSLRGIVRGFVNVVYGYDKLRDLKGEWDIVFLSSLDARARMYIRGIKGSSTVIVHPWLELLSTSIRGLAKIEVAGWTRIGEAYAKAREVYEDLKRELVVVVDNFESALPVPKPKVVVKLVSE